MNTWIERRCYIHIETEKSYGITFKKEKNKRKLYWLPKSQVNIIKYNNDILFETRTFRIPKWLYDNITSQSAAKT